MRRTLLLTTGALLLAQAPLLARTTGRRAQAARRPAPRAMVAGLVPHSVPISGKALRSDGTPAAGAKLYLTWLNEQSTQVFKELTAGPDGGFRHTVKLLQPVSPVAALAVAPGQISDWTRLTVRGKTPPPMRVQLRTGATVSGRVVRPDGSPAAGAKLGVEGLTNSFVPSSTRPDEFIWFSLQKVLPAPALKRMYHPVAAADGSFKLEGLPHGPQVTLKMADGLLLAPGSAGPIRIGAGSITETHLLIAVRSGGVRVRVVDQDTGMPAPGVSGQIVPADIALSSLEGGFSAQGPNPQQSNAAGEIVFPGLVPGDYSIFVRGNRLKVTVKDGEVAGPLEVRTRTAPMAGRVLDAAGKPVANQQIVVEVAPESRPPQPGLIFGGFSPPDMAAGTNPTGEFVLPEFPWGSPAVTVRATRGNEQAEWHGAPSALPPVLQLRLQPNALITVRGRLLTPQRQPVPAAAFSVIRWRDAPRIAWLADAQHGGTDASGSFTVNGLRRGESFSLVSGGPFGAGTNDPFEGPRFTTESGPPEQDLGDVIVHPLDGSAQVVQLYGFDSAEQFTRMIGFLKAPSGQDVAAARAAWDEYRQALQGADFERARRLTSHVSFGWAEDPERFLLLSSLPSPGNAMSGANLQPLRFVPALSAGYMLAFRDALRSEGKTFSFGNAARRLAQEPDWVFLASTGSGRVELAGVLHKEEGAWRVMSLPEGLATQILFLEGETPANEAAGFGRRAPAPLDPQGAETAAAGFLRAWRGGDASTQLSLTSPVSTLWARDEAQFRKLLKQRTDEGASPLPDGVEPVLQPMADLSMWEQQFLVGYARILASLSGSGRQAEPQQVKELPPVATLVRDGKVAAFRYRGEGTREYGILLLRRAGKWQVLEPAMQLAF